MNTSKYLLFIDDKRKQYLKILKLYIRYYFGLVVLKKSAIKKFIFDLKRVRGLAGSLFLFFLTFLTKTFLFFFLLGGFNPQIEFGSFLSFCSFLFFPELIIFDFSKFISMGIYKIVPIIFLIIFANIITIIYNLEKFKRNKKDKVD